MELASVNIKGSKRADVLQFKKIYEVQEQIQAALPEEPRHLGLKFRIEERGTPVDQLSLFAVSDILDERIAIEPMDFSLCLSYLSRK